MPKNIQEHRLKYRLTGLFILFIAGIGIYLLLQPASPPPPILLEFVDEQQTTIPAQAATDKAPATVDETNTPSSPPPKKQRQKQEITTALPPKPVEQNLTAKSSLPRKLPKLLLKPSEVKGWGVQLASFGDLANAKSLATELHRDGYEAFILPGMSGNNKVYRVYAAQFIDREHAENLIKPLQRKYNIRPLIVKLPPRQ